MCFGSLISAVRQSTPGLRLDGEIPTCSAQRDGEAGNQIEEAHDGQHQEHASARRLDQQELDEVGGEHQRRLWDHLPAGEEETCRFSTV